MGIVIIWGIVNVIINIYLIGKLVDVVGNVIQIIMFLVGGWI